MLLPTQEPSGDGETLLELAAGSEQLTTLVAAVEAAGLSEALAGEGPLTVFAPTNEAFAALGEETLKELLSESGRPRLQRILQHHVIAGALTSGDVVGADQLGTLAGTSLEPKISEGRATVSGAALQVVDLRATNGVVHVIDRVLLPPADLTAAQTLLTLAIGRGAQLFNDGDHAACCAVYATALDALRLGSGFGITEPQREVIRGLMEQAETAGTKRKVAWAYRAIIDAAYRGELPTSAPEAAPKPAPGLIFGFEDPAQVDAWRIVLDGVMGGLSTGKARQGDGSLIFAGETSLENNGGFSSMRCALPAGALDGADSFRLRVKGDGRTYIFGARSSSRASGASFWSRFDTVAGEWQTIDVKIEDMERTFFGRPVGGRITPDQVKAIEFYIYDKKAGPFRLEIDEIRAASSTAATASPGL